LGQHEINSSSIFFKLEKLSKLIVSRGYCRVLHTKHEEVKLKELNIAPSKKLSMQGHKNRSEYWFIIERKASVNKFSNSSIYKLIGELKKHGILIFQKSIAYVG